MQHELHHELDSTLAERTARWLEIANGRETYGAGTAVEQSTRFQMEQLLPLTARRCHAKLDPLLQGQVDGLVSLVGMSPQTTIMVTEALRPMRLLLVSSSNSHASSQAIESWLCDPKREWRAPRPEVRPIPPTDPDAIGAAVRDWVRAIRAQAPAARVVLDATGGKKSMSVVAGMLAVELGLEVVYLDSAYDPSLRMPRPGSEVVVPIRVPR